MGPPAEFREVASVAKLLEGYPAPWFVAGGWAVDLFLGARTRPHADVDVAVLRRDQGALRGHLAGWTLSYVVPGRREPPRTWRGSERLDPPVHEVHARRIERPVAEVEFLLEDAVGDAWTYRRSPGVSRPLAALGSKSPAGVPFLAPEIVLLYKATRPEDPRNAADFDALWLRLPAPARAWLADALERAHPACPWIERLRSGPLSNRRTFVRQL